MSNREQRNSQVGAQQGSESSPPSAACLADELTAVLKLIATQNAKTRAAEAHAEQSHAGAGGNRASDIDGRSLSDLGPSAAIDRIQDEISALERRLDSSPAASHSAPAAASEPWDAESAEALTRTYEAAFAAPPRDLHASGAYHAIPGASSDREWLESRFADIAAKVESSLFQAREQSAKQIDGRLDNLEARICDALDGLATRSDIEKLKPADADFGAIASQFDRAAGHLSRLDTIEGNLEAVLNRLSDERFYFDAPSGDRGQVDVKALAEAAADNVVTRLSEMGVGRVDSAELTEIRQAIDVIIEERRRHDEQSNTILETLQQAMISVLDRVDALTQSLESKTGVQAQQSTASPSAAKAEAGNAGGDWTSDAAGRPQNYHEPVPALGGSGDFPAYPSAEPPSADDSARHYQSALPPLEKVDYGEPDSRYAHDNGPDLSTIDRIRQDLIADAKRAKQQAAERASQTHAPSNVAPDLSGAARPVRDDGARKKKRSQVKAAPASNGTIFGVQRRKLLIGAVIVLFATAGALMMMRATSSTAPSAPPHNVEQPSSVAPASATGVGETQPDGRSSDNGAGKESRETGAGRTGRAGTSPIEGDATSEGTRTVVSNLHGITLQSSRALTPEQYALLSEKQAMAHFSEKLGEAAAHATPAAVFPQAQEAADPVNDGSVANPNAGSAMASRTPLNLPPATVGPMSLRLAAAKGDPSAEFEVGARLAEGKGTDQDFKEAARWYQRSAAQGFAQAQYRLGTLYERGLGMPKDLARAAVWYQRAADNGNVKAMHNLAVLSAGADAGESEYATAIRWFTAAADRGLADSQYNLAILYENGLGTAKDLKQAYKYFTLAARSGDQQAKRRREMLRGQLSAEDLNAAERMVELWVRKPVDRLANDARAAGEDWKTRADNRYDG